jgi:phage repressor protein C with HTH and peptisase S24 domain
MMKLPTTLTSLADRLILAMDAANLTQRQLADKITADTGEAISQVAIQKITSGKTQHPKRLPDIAVALGVKIDWLAHGSDNLETSTRIETGDKTNNGEQTISGARVALRLGWIPVKGTARLSRDGAFQLDTGKPGDSAGRLMVQSDDPNAYGLRVLGDSLSPRIKHGEYLIIEPSQPPVALEEAVVELTDGQMMVKIFVGLFDGFFRFDPVNGNGAPLHIAEADVAAILYVGGIIKGSRFLAD